MNLNVLPNFKTTDLLYKLEGKVTAKKFRDAVYYQGPTLLLIQANKGQIFGGFSPIQWTEGLQQNNWISTADAFLFTLTDNKGREPLKVSYYFKLFEVICIIL